MTADELLDQAEANGYKEGEHKEEAGIWDRHKHTDEVKKKNQDAALNRYILQERLYMLIVSSMLIQNLNLRWCFGEQKRQSPEKADPSRRKYDQTTLPRRRPSDRHSARVLHCVCCPHHHCE